MDAEKSKWPVNITQSEALNLIKQFFPHEWSSVAEDDIRISRSEGGIVNEVYFVSLGASDRVEEKIIVPKQLVIRKYYTPDPEDAKSWSSWAAADTTPVERALIQWELQKHGLGPKLYGIIPGGRIEEMINCRPFTQADGNDGGMWKDVAKSLARIHSLKLPFPNPKHDMMQTLRKINAEMKKTIPFLCEIASKEVVEIAENDFDSLINWIEPLVNDSRIVFAHNDLHPGNIVVLDQPEDGESKIMIMDFDTAGYGPRCKDLGLFLLSRNNYQQYATRDERDKIYRPFLELYLSEYERQSLDEAIDGNSRDSIDYLITESLVGGMLAFLWYLYFQLKVLNSQWDDCAFTTFTSEIPAIFKIVMNAKEAVVDRLQEISNK